MKLQNILALLILLLITGGLYYFLNVPEAPETVEVQQYVWIIDMEEIEHITIDLPREDMSESFIKISHDSDFPWFFDDEDKTPVNTDRWGGGIPLLLSGPGIDRVIAYDASDDKLDEFGLLHPKMIITMTLDSGKVMNINIGDATPNGAYYYVQAPNTRDVALVDYTWFDVLERLVTEPPYVIEETTEVAAE